MHPHLSRCYLSIPSALTSQLKTPSLHQECSNQPQSIIEQKTEIISIASKSEFASTYFWCFPLSSWLPCQHICFSMVNTIQQINLVRSWNCWEQLDWKLIKNNNFGTLICDDLKQHKDWHCTQIWRGLCKIHSFEKRWKIS